MTLGVTPQREGTRRWPSARVMTSVGFVIVHAAGGAIAVMTLLEARPWLPVLRLLLDFAANGLAQAGVPTWIATGVRAAVVPAGVTLVALVVLLAAVEAAKALWRLSQGRAEVEIGLRVRALVYVAMACIFVNALVFSSHQTFSGPFRLRFAVLGDLSATFAYGAYALWFLMLPRLRRRIPASVRRGLDVVGMNAAMVLILGEVTLRGVARLSPSPLLVTDQTPSQVRRTAGRQRPGTRFFDFPVNSGGDYDTEFLPGSRSGKKTVISIGDSFSYGSVPHAYHFTTVAERASPGIDVYNMGYPNIGPHDYLDLLQREAIPLHPDLVVVQLFIGNDVGESGGLVLGPPRWYDADSYLLAIVWHRLRIMKRAEPGKQAAPTEQSNLSMEQLAVAYPWLTNPLLEKPSFTKDMYLEVETRNAESVCVGDDAATAGSYERLFKTIAVMEQVAEMGSVRLAFVLIPGEFQIEDTLWNAIVQRSKKPMDRERPQRLIGEWMERRGRAVLDLLPVLRAVPPLKDGRAHLYHLQDTHFNARGNEVTGRALAHFVDSLLSNGGPRSAKPQPAAGPISPSSHGRR